MIEMEERKRLSDVDERSYSENSFPGLNDETQSEETVLKDDLLVKITKTLGRWGLEVNGIDPVPPEERSDPRLYQIFFVWFSANANVLTMAAGTVGPAFYGLGIRDACLVIVVVDIITYTIPAYFAVFGPKLGTRSMVQARFSWGYVLPLPTVGFRP